MDFELHPNLKIKTFVWDLPLCRVLLEDECHYPWILLIPRRNAVSKLMDLEQSDQLQLLNELDVSQKILWNLFHPAQLNVAAIGNKTPQLHIHLIVRQITDPAWPLTVWDHPIRASYSSPQKAEVIEKLTKQFEKCFK